MAPATTAGRFIGVVFLFTAVLALFATTLHNVFASPRGLEHSKRSSDDEPSKRSYPVHAERPYNYFPRQVAPFQNTSSDPGVTTTSSSTPAVPFGVYVTTIDGIPYTLTYVSTTATADTTIVESDASTTTTEDVTAGAPIWAVPTLPPGFPLPPPGPPPGAPAAVGGAIGCLFGCGAAAGGLPCVVDCGGSGGDPTDDPTDDPSDSASSSSTSSSSSSTSSTTSTTTTTSSTTSTTTSTTTTTSSTSSPVERCSYGCSACNFGRRSEPSAKPVYDRQTFDKMLQFARDNSVHVGTEERELTDGDADEPEIVEERSIPMPAAAPNTSLRSNKRGIPLEGDADGIPDFYSGVESAAGTVKVELTGGFSGGTPSSQMITWDGNDHNILVTGLEGCTSVLVVSQKGGYASHFWETPAFTFTDPSAFQSGVLDYLQSSLGSVGDVFSSDSNPKVYIMSPADPSQTVQQGDMSDGTLSTSLSPDPEFSDKVGQIAGALGSLVPGASIDYFYYARQRNDIKLNGAYGKAFISYSGKQTVNPDDVYDMNDLNPPISIWQVWTQGQKMGEDRWGGVCSGNQKRQDGGSCELTTTSSSTSTSSTSSTSSSTSTTSTTSSSTSTTSTTSSSSSTSTPPPTTTSSSSSPPPPPSCQTATASGAVCTLCEGSVDPACTPIGPPTPSQTSSNNKGSALCKSAISGDDCKAAYSRYDDNRIYTGYTSYTATNPDSDINYWLAPFANDGCTAIFACDNDGAYATGMAGWQIKAAFDNLYANDDVKTCGSSYLSNSCHITANGCQDCKDVNA